MNKLLLIPLFTLLLISASFVPAEALKSQGISTSRVGVDICGDRLCESGETMTPQEKLGYYLMSLLEFEIEDDPVQQQGLTHTMTSRQSPTFDSSVSWGKFSSQSAPMISAKTLSPPVSSSMKSLSPPTSDTLKKFTMKDYSPISKKFDLSARSISSLIDKTQILSGKIDFSKVTVKKLQPISSIDVGISVKNSPSFGELKYFDTKINYYAPNQIFILPFDDRNVTMGQTWTYTWEERHAGIDYGLESRETFEVRAAADGIVTNVTWRHNSAANVVTISHNTPEAENHYQTMYQHLRNGAENDCIQTWNITVPSITNNTKKMIFEEYLEQTGCKKDDQSQLLSHYWGTNEEKILVKIGDVVRAGDLIAWAGNTGGDSVSITNAATHLHIYFFERDLTIDEGSKNDPWDKIDPYGIYDTRDCYPDVLTDPIFSSCSITSKLLIFWKDGVPQYPCFGLCKTSPANKEISYPLGLLKQTSPANKELSKPSIGEIKETNPTDPTNSPDTDDNGVIEIPPCKLPHPILPCVLDTDDNGVIDVPPPVNVSSCGNAGAPNILTSTPDPLNQLILTGPDVMTVRVCDDDISATDEAKGEPDVTVNGKLLRMIQADDGDWYGYLAIREEAQQADSLSNPDFGEFCDKSSYLDDGVNFSDTAGIAVNGPMTGSVNGLDTISGNMCSGTVSSSTSTAITSYPAINTNANVSPGQIGLAPDSWPLIQLYEPPVNDDEIVVMYNKGGGVQLDTWSYVPIYSIP